MKDKIVININAPQKQVAKLFADPSNNTKWMDDLEYYEPLSGTQGTPGSKYRLVSKSGAMRFTATVIERRMPKEVWLNLESSTVTVDVRGKLSTLPDGRTRLVSEEVFKFKGVWRKAFGVFAKPAIRKTHRRHLENFKRFAERQKER